eukprot:11171524-Lingulodinium_polyedra.AAC.1
MPVWCAVPKRGASGIWPRRGDNGSHVGLRWSDRGPDSHPNIATSGADGCSVRMFWPWRHG